MDDRLSHLSENDLSNLVSLYLGGEKVADLILKYNIQNVRPSELVRLLPPEQHSDLFCPYCAETNLVSKIGPRQISYGKKTVPHCPRCGHRNMQTCRCENCKAKNEALRAEQEADERLLIEKMCQFRISIPAVETLSLFEAVVLAALYRGATSDDLETATPFAVVPPILLTGDLGEKVLDIMIIKGFIGVSADSPVSGFCFDDDKSKVTQYYPTRVSWVFMPSLTTAERRAYLKELERIIEEAWPMSWKEEAEQLWREIVKTECLEHFRFHLAERGYELDKVGEKTFLVLDQLLSHFTPAQVCYLSYLAARDTVDYIVRKQIPPYIGKNIFIGALQRKGDRARAEGWQIRSSLRDRNCPRTVVSSTFFDAFMKIGESAFNMRPPRSVIEAVAA